MNLYLISNNKNNDYDTYDSAIVCAENEDLAKMIHPGGYPWDGNMETYGTWCCSEDVEVELIGEAKEGLNKVVVISSFNAG